MDPPALFTDSGRLTGKPGLASKRLQCSWRLNASLLVILFTGRFDGGRCCSQSSTRWGKAPARDLRLRLSSLCFLGEPSIYIHFPRYQTLNSGEILKLHITIMICQRCLLQVRASYPASSRGASANSARAKASILFTPRRRPSPTTSKNPPTAQSFSNSPPSPDPSPSATNPSEPTTVSSVPAGTPLKGLGYLKGIDPPLAKEDNEYPKWLWGLLDEGKMAGKKGGGDEQGDSYCKPDWTRQVGRCRLQELLLLPSRLLRCYKHPSLLLD